MSRFDWRRYLIPREHGAWAMWIVPFVICISASGGLTLRTVLVFLAALLGFLARTAFGSGIRLFSREPLQARRCILAGLLQCFVALLCIMPIFLSGNTAFMKVCALGVAILGADLVWIRQRMEKNLAIELVGVSGFVLSAPALYVANKGGWQATALWLWLFCFVYFAGSVFYVKLRLARTAAKGNAREKEKRYAGFIIGYTILVSLCLVLVVAVFGMAGWVLLAYVPWLFYLLMRGFKPAKNLNRVGWALLAHSLYFTIILSVFFIVTAG